jgi:hypothetical protein
VLEKMQLYVGGEDGFRKVNENALLTLANHVLMPKVTATRFYDQTKEKKSSDVSKSFIFTPKSKPKPPLSFGASALHSLNHLEMSAQSEWLGLHRQLTVPGAYDVDIEFRRVLDDFTESREFHFLMRGVHLLADPNDMASDDRFFLVDLTKPGSRAIFRIGTPGMVDVIRDAGLLNIVVREKKSDKIVKQLAIEYAFEPQKTLRYNTKVSTRLHNDVTIHARFLGSSYMLEDIIIRQ